MRIPYGIGKAVALALCCIPVVNCSNPFASNPRILDQAAIGATADPRVRAFYAARQNQLAWDDASQKQLSEAIDGAPFHGLRRSLFLKSELPKGQGEKDVALTSAALRYASALATGYSDPTKLGRIYTVPRPGADVVAGLAKALENDDLKAWYDSLAPQTAEYQALSQEFTRSFKLAETSGESPVIPAGKAIKPNRTDPRLPAIATALANLGYVDRQAGQSRRYSPAMVAAVKQLQSDYGMEPDGIIGAATIKALIDGPADRARQIAVNLERLRWLDRKPPETRIDVNTAAATLEYWRDGRLRDERTVVVGQPEWETPQLGSPIFQLVAHPYWRVPDSIFEDELASKGQTYFAQQNMEFRDGKLVQLPGPKNSLGDVKFDMRNGEHIYLHDTPFKALFDLPERHRSHGCVRVRDAVGFALMLASDDGVLQQFQDAMLKPDQEGFVKLRNEVPVRLMYRTAFLDKGTVRLVEDRYGWDDEVAYALGYVRRPPRAKRAHKGGDVGP